MFGSTYNEGSQANEDDAYITFGNHVYLNDAGNHNDCHTNNNIADTPSRSYEEEDGAANTNESHVGDKGADIPDGTHAEKGGDDTNGGHHLDEDGADKKKGGADDNTRKVIYDDDNADFIHHTPGNTSTNNSDAI